MDKRNPSAPRCRSKPLGAVAGPSKAFCSIGQARLRRGGHLPSDMSAEKVTDTLSFAQPVHHLVEPALQLAEFGAVEHDEVGVQIALFDPAQRRADHLVVHVPMSKTDQEGYGDEVLMYAHPAAYAG